MHTHLYLILIIMIIIIIKANKQDHHRQHYKLEKKITKVPISLNLKFQNILKIILKFQTKLKHIFCTVRFLKHCIPTLLKIANNW